MLIAIEQAELAAECGEVAVGAALYFREQLIISAHNETQLGSSPLKHAEMLVLEQALALLGREKLRECELFVTLEPCPMCAGAIIAAHPKTLVFGAYDPEYGAADGFVNLFSHPRAAGIAVYGGICESRCSMLLSDFFAELRKKKDGSARP